MEQIKRCFLSDIGPGFLPEAVGVGPRRIVGMVVPHAGYVYSGPVAAHAYAELSRDGTPETFVLIGPNHTGIGALAAIMTGGEWETPLSSVPVHEELAKKILEASSLLEQDAMAFVEEHSLEVQLPFLQFVYGEKVSIVPILLLMQNLAVCRDLGNAIAQSVKELGVDAVILASSDFTHYAPHDYAKAKDESAIKLIAELKPEEFLNKVSEENLSICGAAPIAAMLFASLALGAKRARLLKYATSGDVTGDYASVVGYASIAVEK